VKYIQTFCKTCELATKKQNTNKYGYNKQVGTALEQHSRYFPEMDFVGLVFGELSGTAQHSLDRAGHQRVLPLDDELVAVAWYQFDVHGVGTFATAISRLLVLKAKGRYETIRAATVAGSFYLSVFGHVDAHDVVR